MYDKFMKKKDWKKNFSSNASELLFGLLANSFCLRDSLFPNRSW